MSSYQWLAVVSAAMLPTLSCSAPAPATGPAGDHVVPITLTRNKVIVPVRVQGSRPLRLILDTGMGFEGVLLFSGGMKDSIGAERLNRAQIPGAGGGPPSEAFYADSLSLQVGDVRLDGQRVIVLADSAMGRGGNDGVIGYSLLGRYAVELDYDRLTMTLHEPTSFQPGDGWAALPLTLNDRNWPFLQVSAVIDSGAPTPLTVYIDCASSETIEFLTGPQAKFPVAPGTREVFLGRGLSGDIHGRRGHISRLAIGPFELKDIQAAFVPATIRSKARGADAVLANGALCRFNVVFDYARSRLLLRPNRHTPDDLD